MCNIIFQVSPAQLREELILWKMFRETQSLMLSFELSEIFRAATQRCQ